MAETAENKIVDLTAAESMVHAGTNIGAATILPRRSKRGRKRKAATVLTPQAAAKVTDKIRATLKNIHMVITLRGYAGYARGINDFYCKNHPEVCNMQDKVINRKKLLDRIMNPETVDEEISMFMTMIESTQHATLKKADNTPQIMRMGSLNSIRSAFNWYIFTDISMPRTLVV